jgi:hypothetical protein
VVVTKKGGAGAKGGKQAGKGQAGGRGQAGGKSQSQGQAGALPRIVIKVDLTKVGNDNKQQQPKKKQGADGKRKPQQPKVVLH